MMKLNSKRILIALAFAGAFTSAQATTLVPLTGGINLGADPTNAFEYVVDHPAGAFSDIFNFTLSTQSNTVSSAVALSGSGFGFSNGTLTLSDAANVVRASSTWGSSSGSVVLNNVAAGSYYWTVAGTQGDLGGAYLYGVNTLAVPEPETYALMLAGLGLIGFIGRRRFTGSGNSGPRCGERSSTEGSP